uniref:Methylcytosine dioxygenase n=1 Tax=Mesocestoides corti TaxID=53468 RepID=A0A5K3G2J2_MESCO
METSELLEKQLRLKDHTQESTQGQERDIPDMQEIGLCSCRPAPAQTTQHAEYCNWPCQPVNSISTAAVFEGKQVTGANSHHVPTSTTVQQLQGNS